MRRVAANNLSAAAVLVELIQGEGGVNVCHPDYLAGLRAICDENHWLLMLDEVQSGTGRTGTWFAFQHSGVKPDVAVNADDALKTAHVSAIEGLMANTTDPAKKASLARALEMAKSSPKPS